MCKNTATNGKIQIYECLKYYLFLPIGNRKTAPVHGGYTYCSGIECVLTRVLTVINKVSRLFCRRLTSLTIHCE
jgi:hypothetical protein